MLCVGMHFFIELFAFLYTMEQYKDEEITFYGHYLCVFSDQ